MISNLKLKTKLVSAFVAIALVTCVVTAIAWWNLSVLRGKLSDVAKKHLPVVHSLGDIRLGLEMFKMSRRAMKDPNLELSDYHLMLDRIARATESYEASMKTLAALDMTPEEAAMWNDFQAKWAEWRKANDEYFHISRGFAEVLEPIASAQLPNPGALLNHTLDAITAIRGVESEICKHVQAWNNLILCGDNAENYSNYSAEMEACTRRANANIAALRAIAPEIGLEQNSITTVETLCRALTDRYRTALKELKTRNTETSAKLGQTLHAASVPAVAAIDSLTKGIDSKAMRMRALTVALYGVTREKCLPAELQAMNALGKLIDHNVAESERGLKTAEQAYSAGLFQLVMGTLVGVGLAIVFGIIIALSISRPLSGCVAFAEAMAAGDLTRTQNVTRRDEIGQLVAALNSMGANLRQMFANIVENTQALAGSASELSATATQLAGGAEETTNQSNAVAAAAEEMSANMNSVAASTEQMSANVRVVASAVEELTSSITEVARSAEQAAGVANTAAGLADDGNARITELGAAATKIGNVIEVIQDIAEQTSLLALNATIEAARAGDAGKGFAVVATEVKELAKQTAAATEDIRRRIEEIQTSTGHAVRAIGEITEVIKTVNEVSRTIASAVEEQSITTREIAKNVAETSTAAQTVARGVAESASVTREIAKNISEVDTAARQTSQGATVAQAASSKVSDVSEQLHALVGQFKTSA